MLTRILPLCSRAADFPPFSTSTCSGSGTAPLARLRQRDLVIVPVPSHCERFKIVPAPLALDVRRVVSTSRALPTASEWFPLPNDRYELVQVLG